LMEDSSNLMKSENKDSKKKEIKLAINVNKKLLKANKSSMIKIIPIIILLSLIVVSSFIYIYYI